MPKVVQSMVLAMVTGCAAAQTMDAIDSAACKSARTQLEAAIDPDPAVIVPPVTAAVPQRGGPAVPVAAAPLPRLPLRCPT